MKLFIAYICFAVLFSHTLTQESLTRAKSNKQGEQVSPPVAVDRGAKATRCPATYEKVGKECIKVVTQAAAPQCGSSSQLTPEQVCATYSGKSPVCPAGFNPQGNSCEHQQTATPTQVCPNGYTLTNDNQCVRPREEPPKQECPSGSVLKGDSCIAVQEREPTFGCPPGFTLSGRTCRTEQLYNCTPPRPDNPESSRSAISIPSPTQPPVSSLSLSNNRPPLEIPPLSPAMFSASSGSFSLPPDMSTILNTPPTTLTSTAAPPLSNLTPSPPFNAPPAPPANPPPFNFFSTEGNRSSPVYSESYRRYVEQSFNSPSSRTGERWRRTHGIPVNDEFDYVVQSVCRKVRIISAQMLCEAGVLTGKTCLVDVEVPLVSVSASSVSAGVDVQTPETRCPDGRFTLLSPTLCLLVEFANFNYVCPERTTDTGDRCVSYSPPMMTCPPEFTLESDNSCIRTIREQPIVEYSVRYTCVGKNCDTNGAAA